MKASMEFATYPIMIDCEINCTDTPNGDGYPLYHRSSFKLDTGSNLTCLTAEKLGITVSEEEFIQWSKQTQNIKVLTSGRIKGGRVIVADTKGIDRGGDYIRFYAIQVDKFIIREDIGNILDLGSVPIFITFDHRMQSTLLGGDILSILDHSVQYNEVSKNRTLTISLNYISENERIEGAILPQTFIRQGVYRGINISELE